MELIKGEKFNKLVPSEGYVLKLKTDNYTKEIIDEEGNIIEPEHMPNYSSLLYLPLSYTLEDAQNDYEEINEKNAGTLEDPIPYNNNMELFEGLYYIQNEVIYKCTRNTGTAVFHDLKDLVGIYIEIAK